MNQLLERAVEVERVAPRRVPRWRRWLRRALKPLVVAGIAGTLALSLTVTTTQDAQANPLLLPPVIFTGASIMTMGEVAGATALLGPIGWGILGAAAVGAGLYYTKDYWLPYVTGDFGKPKGDDEGTVTNGFVQARAGLVAEPPTPTMTGKSGLQLNVTYATPPRTGTWTIDVAMVCKRPDGSLYSKSMQGNYSYAATTAARFDCNELYEVVQEGQIGAVCSLTVTYTTTHCTSLSPYYGPTNVVSWGVKSKPFDPESPDVKYKTTVECVRADGTKFSLDAESTGDQKGFKVPSCAAVEAGSHGTGKMTVVGTPPGSSTGETILDRPAATASPSDYPLCSPAKPGPGCALSVWVDGKECVVGNWNCAHWKEIDQTRVQCNFGPYVGVPVNSCNPLERAYEEGGVPATESNTDGNPSTRSDTDPNGNTVPKNSTGTGTGTIPQTGVNPGVDGVPGESGENCLATGWSWNPVSWVMVPTQCALQWAFVPPRVRVDTALQTIQPRLEVRGIEPLIAPFLANFAGLGGNGCQGPGIDLGSIGVSQTFYPFAACTEPMSGIATGVNAFFSLSIVVQGGMSCIRGAAAAFGFNWGLGGKPGTED